MARANRAALLDHLVGAQPNRWGYGKAERVGGLAVHDHLKLWRKLHREIARLLAGTRYYNRMTAVTGSNAPMTPGAARAASIDHLGGAQ